MKLQSVLQYFGLAVCCSVLLYLWYDPNSLDLTRRMLVDEGKNHHKALFPLEDKEIYGTIFLIVALFIASASGIGGGGILVPVYIIIFHFKPKQAVALSNLCIFGNAIINIIVYGMRRHPLADRPLVDWDLLLIFEPLTIAGAIAGAIIGKILPDWVVVVALVGLLSFTSYTTTDIAIKQYQKENKAMEIEASNYSIRTRGQLQEYEEVRPLIPGANSSANAANNSISSTPATSNKVAPPSPTTNYTNLPTVDESDSGGSKELARALEADRHLPLGKIAIAITLVAVVIVLNFLKSDNASFHNPIGVTCGSQGYWAITAVVFIWVVAIALIVRAQVIRSYSYKKKIHYPFLPCDIQWDNPRYTVTYPLLCIVAGMFAGLLGIGGALVKGPLMLSMGIHPVVTSSTCATMIFFTSLTATVMYATFGMVTWDYGAYFVAIGMITTLIGQNVINYLVQKYQRISLISFTMAAIVIISTILLTLESVYKISESMENGNAGKVDSLCDAAAR